MDRKTLRVGVLGATGAVGQRFVSMLDEHPWFRLEKLMASDRSTGKTYMEATQWMLPKLPGNRLKTMVVERCCPDDSLDLVFSGLPASDAIDIEPAFARAGIPVVSNTSSHRMVTDVPLVIPEVNPDHLDVIPEQRKRWGGKGFIVTNPNCSTIALVMALDPVHRAYKIEKVVVSTAQAVSGAGYPGLSVMTMLDNAVPFIPGEEEKLESEPLKIFGVVSNGKIRPMAMSISAGCTRVAVRDGHLMHVSFGLARPAGEEDVLRCWRDYHPEIQSLDLPGSPEFPVQYLEGDDRPQPLLDRDRGAGMTVSIGRLRACPVMGWKCVVLGHNTIRGAAGGAILLAELLVRRGFIDGVSSS